MRSSVYPRWIGNVTKMTESQASREISTMARKLLRWSVLASEQRQACSVAQRRRSRRNLSARPLLIPSSPWSQSAACGSVWHRLAVADQVARPAVSPKPARLR